jgi:predicted DNA-binding transcriptional regulator YafY
MAELDECRAPVKVVVKAQPHAVGWLRATFGTRMRTGETGDDGRIEVELRMHHVNSAAVELAGFGANIEIVSPDEIRIRLAAIGEELVRTHAGG